MSTVESFERDLLECGVPSGDVQPLGDRYARALETCSYIDWIELYVGIFATLVRAMHRTGVAKQSAAKRTLLLLNDDLGCELFDSEARAQLTLALHGVPA